MDKERTAQIMSKPRAPRSRRGNGAAPPAKGRQTIREGHKARLLEAAETVFAERGYAGASTAAIAAKAKLPKANLHYYFRTKEMLYRAVLANVLEMWLGELDRFTPEREPAEVIADYVAAKMRWSRTRPNASKVFANEVLHGAPFLDDYLTGELRARVTAKSRIVRRWIKAGKLAPVDPRHLIFQLWAVTQHYADFEVQVRAVLGRNELTDRDYKAAAESITQIVLRGCLAPSPGPSAQGGRE